MLFLKFFHTENLLLVGDREYHATCDVRNEINGRRTKNQVIKTFPSSGGERSPYYPRKFPTGTWKIKNPVWTTDVDFAPVKIPTDAFQRVLLWDTDRNGYKERSGEHQTDSFYHLHFAKNSITTLGCIRLNSERDAIVIAIEIEKAISKGQDCWLEVFVNKE